MATTIRISIKVQKYLWKEFVVDVLRIAVHIFYFIVWAYRPIASFLEEVVSSIKKVLLFISAILFGIISMIVVFGLPFAFIYGVMMQR